MIEMEDMGLQKVGPKDKVPGQTTVGGNLDSKGIVKGQDRGHGMGGRTDTADALRQLGGIPGVTAHKNVFETTIHPANTLGVHNLTVPDFDLDLEMPLDPGHRINGDLDFFGGNSCNGSFAWLTS
jgi:hypothetical protein